MKSLLILAILCLLFFISTAEAFDSDEMTEELLKNFGKRFNEITKITKKAFKTYNKYKDLMPLEDRLMSENIFKKIKKTAKKLGKKIKSKLKFGVKEKVKCFFNCLKGQVSIPKLTGIVLTCNVNKACYIAHLGVMGGTCAAKCIRK